jgi:hypothetical protein
MREYMNQLPASGGADLDASKRSGLCASTNFSPLSRFASALDALRRFRLVVRDVLAAGLAAGPAEGKWYAPCAATPIVTKLGVGSTIARRIRISRFDDESGSCSGFEAQRRSRNSAQFTLRPTIISTRSVISSSAKSTNRDARPRWPNGAKSRLNAYFELRFVAQRMPGEIGPDFV